MNKSVVNYPATSNFDFTTWGTDRPPTVNENSWLNSGFLYTQQLIDRSIVAYISSNSNVTLETGIRKFPYPAFTSKDAQRTLAFMMPFYLLLIFSIQVRTTLTSILEEKEKKIREGMLMVGLKDWVNQLSWLLTSMIKVTVVIIVVVPVGIHSDLFEGCDGTLLFVFFWLFCLATAAFTFFIATFFSSSQTGGMLGYLIYFALSTPAAIIVTRDDVSATGKLLSCLLSPCAFFLGTRIVNDAQGNGQALTWETISDPTLSDVNVAFSSVICMLFVDVTLYFLLAWYVGKVWPNEYGTTLPWYFPFTKWYWLPGSSTDSSVSQDTPAVPLLSSNDTPSTQVANNIQPRVGQQGVASVRVCGLTKTFKKGIKAVEEVTWDAYENEITALLGHNGAGKSVTISMLTGLYPPTSGNAYVNNHAIGSHMDKVRQSIGVCPQHDILWDELTVHEHLRIFASIKGLAGQQLEAAVTDKIREVGLEEKRNENAMSLSGGMKRRLSVAMALIGDPRVVFLDEPTSGMDPEGRRQVWDLLRQAKQHRAIILTTHFMDEADLLGDRIAIMATGKLRVMGTSLFLKNRYGIGYHLNLVKKAGFSAQRVTEFVRRHVPLASILSNTAGEFAMVLPLASAPSFADLFTEFDTSSESLGISSYGVSVTTLEEVFLKLADEYENAGDEVSNAIHSGHMVQSFVTPDVNGLSDPVSSTDPGHDIPMQGGALSPVSSPRDGGGLSDKDEDEVYRVYGIRGMPSTERQTIALVRKKLNSARRNKRAIWIQFGLPVMFVLISTGFRSLTSLTKTTTGDSVSLSPFDQLSSHHLDSPYHFQFASPSMSQPVFFPSGLNASSLISMTPTIPNALSPAFYMPQSVYDQIQPATDPFAILGTYNLAVVDFTPSDPAQNYTIAYNDSSYASLPMAMSVVNGGWIKALKGRTNNTSVGVAVTYAPFSRVAGEQTSSDPGAYAAASSTVIYMSFGIISIMGIAVTNVVREKENKIKQHLITCGTKPLAYWSSQFLFDIMFYSLPLGGITAIVAAFNVLGLAGSHLIGTFLLFMLFGFAALPLAYMCSFFFDVASTATTVTLLGQSFLNIALLVGYIVLSIPTLVSNPNIAKILEYIGYLFPNFALSAGLYKLSSSYATCATQRDLDPSYNSGDCDKSDHIFAWNMLMPNLIYLVGDAVLFWSLTLHLERRAWLRLTAPTVASGNTNNNNTDAGDVGEDDIDVKTEEIRVMRLQADIEAGHHKGKELVRVLGLQKSYETGTLKRPAVRNLTLGIPSGECFGLLGPNGAGKTTAISMLTGATRPTQGTAILHQHNIQTHLTQAFLDIGYCGQHDALDDLLTVEEELRLYAHIKCVPKQDLESVVFNLLARTTLLPHRYKLTKELSGGNKRKLSLAIALIGNPRIVFLDEPSTGMDPKARRAMWQIISDSIHKGGRAMVLTTHLMEECEALCQRIGILVKGRLACLGTAQHLKSRFGKGYHVEVSLADASTMDRVRDLIARVAPGAQETEVYGTHIKFELPRLGGMSLGEIFRQVEANKEQLKIEDYSISQTTLEQVFMRFAKAQQQEADQTII
eukprot:c12109_g1_i2.p1 GENE.c12109_g1_i2~~c12109_g1_i2.p1  ORF type:complete len:1737 (+),score=451.65 c12109_g1_i2:522-5213(+)